MDKAVAKTFQKIMKEGEKKSSVKSIKLKVKFNKKDDKKKQRASKTIKLPKKELVEEHKELVKTLQSPDRSKHMSMAKEQKEELHEYQKSRSYGQKEFNKDMRKALTPTKAKTILTDKSVKGHPLTDKQKKFFGFVAGGGKPTKSRK